MEGVSSNILSSLTNGSGIDIQKLARDLADVEKAPREERLLTHKSEEEAKISALSVLKFNVEQLIAQFNQLNDASELSTPNVSVSDSPSLKIISTDGLATAGQHEVAISSLATSQRNFSNQFNSPTVALNGGSGFNITHTSTSGHETSIAIADGNDTPEGIVAAINASGTDVTAVLIQEDSDATQYRVVLQSATGAGSGFSVTSTLTDSDLGFHDATNGNSVSSNGVVAAQIASDASLTVNGLQVARPNNLVNDVIPGISFNLTTTHSGSESDQIFVSSDTSTLKSKLNSLVKSYNDVQYALTELSSSDSDNDELSGALKRDLAAIRTVRDTVYEAITATSTTPSGDVSALRDIGVNLTKSGLLEFNESEFDTQATANFSDIATMLSAGTTNQSRYDAQAKGLSMDAIITLEELTDQFTGVFAIRSNTANTNLLRLETELTKLTERTELIYQRYIEQFTAMETLVSRINSTRDSMTDSWRNLGLYKDS